MKINNLRFDRSNLLIFTIIFIGLAVIFSFGMGSVAAATPTDTIYVNSSGGNDANNGSSWLYAKQSISNATGTVETNGTINIADGQYTGYSNTGIILDTNMTIIGESQANTIIDAQGNGNIFDISQDEGIDISHLSI